MGLSVYDVKTRMYKPCSETTKTKLSLRFLSRISRALCRESVLLYVAVMLSANADRAFVTNINSEYQCGRTLGRLAAIGAYAYHV